MANKPTVIHTGLAPEGERKWQSGLFWIDWVADSSGPYSKAVISWPMKCQAAAIPLPDGIKSQAEALEFLRNTLTDGLKEENGVNGPS